MKGTPASAAVDHAVCDREPIRIPGAIQPHGLLVVLDPEALAITQISENVGPMFGRDADAVLGRSLSSLLDDTAVNLLRHALEQEAVEELNPLPVRAGERDFDCIVHRQPGAIIAELEPAVNVQQRRSGHHILKPVVMRIQDSVSVEDLGQRVVEEVHRLTGFERVMLYRFGDQGHGHVAAEVRTPGLESYLGVHYPASDIPRQARDLYLQNWLRSIPDAAYAPARILPELRPDTGAPLDLSCAVLRSVSPIHRQYLANMGVRASMSVSLVVRGQLWGLISCTNHSGPLHLAYEVRSACEVFGRLVSWEIAALEEQELAALRHARRGVEGTLANAMKGPGGDVLGSLLACPDELLTLVDAHGAAVVVDDQCRVLGDAVPPAFVVELAKWLDEREARTVFATDSLANLYPPALEHKDAASGVLAIALPGTPSRRLLWFRPERLATVKWGGNPGESVVADPNGYPHPRTSFDIWKEQVRLHSLPWSASAMEAAASVRRYAIEADLELQVSKQQIAVRARDDTLAIVSHDLRSPLSVLSLQAKLLLRFASDEEEGLSRALRSTSSRIQRSVDQMNSLINNLLDLAQIEAGTFSLAIASADVREIVDEVMQSLKPLAEAKDIVLTERIEGAMRIRADRLRFSQVLTNLVGNAIKFTPAGGQISLDAKCAGDNVEFTIADTGSGISPEHLEHLFDRYWRAGTGGVGLGLFIVKGIIDAHGGRIRVDSVLQEGTTFVVSLPAA